MGSNHNQRCAVVIGWILLQLLWSSTAQATDLAEMIERDLTALGYDAGTVDGQADVKTAIAISQFQAERGMEVTGEVSPQLAGILAAEVKGSGSGPAAGAAAVPADASPGSTASDSVRRLTWEDLAGVPRGAFSNFDPFSQAQSDAMIACRGSRDPAVRQNLSMLVEHTLGKPSDDPAVRERLGMYDQAFESFQGSLAPRCNSGVVQMGYNSHNGFVSQVLATAASSKANQTALQQPAQPSSAPAPTGAVRLLSPGELKTEPVGVTRGVLADFTQIRHDDVLNFICTGQRGPHKQNSVTIYNGVPWSGNKARLEDQVLNYDAHFDRDYARQAEIARRHDAYSGSTPYCTDERLRQSRISYENKVAQYTR